jgi:SAM-dependent methyltransferase
VEAPTALDRWLATPLGERLLAAERAVVGAALEQVFGTQFLQVGHWGTPDTFLPLARTPRRALLAEPGAVGQAIGHAASLPVMSHAVDAVLLPHTLEFEPEPHAVIREVDRVLVGDGYLLVLGFEPAGTWALRHHLAAEGYPPGVVGLLSRGRLRDWLTLLGFEVEETHRFLHALPLATAEAGAGTRALDRLGRLLGGRLGNAYLLKARKRVYTLTPIRPRRRRAPKLAVAAAETA